MAWTRRQWMAAMGMVPLQLGAIAELTAQGRGAQGGGAAGGGGRGGGGRGRAAADTLASLGPPPTLPDKASFPNIRGTSLDAAATHPRPLGGVEMIKKAAATEAGDAGGFRPNNRRILQAYAKLINADADEVMFAPSTQIGESFVAAAAGVHEKGAHVVSDYLHFVGSQEMYTDLAKRGLEVTWVKMKDNRIPLDEMDRAIVKGKTKLVAISATSFVTGYQHDVKRVCEIAHAKGALVYADIIQAAGNTPIDVKEWGLDAACAATYKWMMSGGTAFLYVRKAALAKMQPPFYHFSNYTRILPATHMYPFDAPGKEIVDDYENKAGIAGMFSMGYEPDKMTLAGLEYSLPYIMNIGVDRIQAHAQPLIARLKEELPKRGYPLLTPVESRSPIVTVAVKDAPSLAPAFTAANIKVTTRWNHIRIAASVFNDMDDVDRLLAAMPKV